MIIRETLGSDSKNVYITVKHRRGSGDEMPSDGSKDWKEFWEKHSGQKFGVCACVHCQRAATDGAHVIKADSVDRHWYIAPLCHKCNMANQGKPFGVLKSLLVPVNLDG